MIVNSTDMQNNFGKYLDMAQTEDITVTKNGTPVARLIGIDSALSFLSDNLVGIVPYNVDENGAKADRLKKK